MRTNLFKFIGGILLAIGCLGLSGQAYTQDPDTLAMSISDGIFPDNFSYVGVFEIEDIYTNVFDFTAAQDANSYRYEDIFGFNPLMSGYGGKNTKENTAKRVCLSMV